MPFDSALHRAAVLIKSLPKKQAARLVMKLDANELQVVFKEMRNIRDQDSSSRVAALRRFCESTKRQAKGHRESGRYDLTKKNSGPFEFLIDTNDDIRHRLLSAEHPQYIATVISFLPTNIASDTLNKFEANERVAILRKLCHINQFDIGTVAELSDRLQDRMRRLLNAEKYERSGVEVASRLISVSDPEMQSSLIDSLDHADADLAEVVLEQVVSFEQLQTLSDRDIKTVLKRVDTSFWAPALKTASKELLRKVLDNLSERPRDILRREIQTFQSDDPMVVDTARRSIMVIVLQLQDRGSIRFPQHPDRQAA